eukprot:SAG22_NODE_6542_length_841_cov_1.377358_2_plen_96_part_01
MPCLYGSDEKCQVMVLHAAWLMQLGQRWAAGDPLVVAGDFNIKPEDPTYQLIANGALPQRHPQHPPPAPGEGADLGWKPVMRPMRSAYAAYHSAKF